MMRQLAILIVVMLLGLVNVAVANDVKTIDKDELRAMLGSPDLVLIDVRTDADWDSSETKIAGAIREEPAEVDQWAGNYDKGKTIVLYCA